MFSNLPVDMIRRIESGADTQVDAAVTARTIYMGIKTNRGFLVKLRGRPVIEKVVDKVRGYPQRGFFSQDEAARSLSRASALSWAMGWPPSP